MVIVRSENELLASAKSGDKDAFDSLVGRFWRELHVHCYRMLGSLEDADDALQDAVLRAWLQVGSFEPRAPFRAWLYRIATNSCLTLLAKPVRSREVAVADLASVRSGSAAGETEVLHLEPYPDRWLDELTDVQRGPEATVEAAESVELAFVAAVQSLPPKQRATVLLRDVLGYAAADVAAMLESTVAGVNSAVQRARETLDRERRNGTVARRHRNEDAGNEAALVNGLITAWQSADIEAMVSLLRADALLAMPPEPLHFIGREAIAWFFRTGPAAGQLDHYRLIPIRANRQPALAAYKRVADDQPYLLNSIVVLAIEQGEIAALTRFRADHLCSRFGLPPQL
jgi:RNA polymerase sigma-70 factor, ECF subfamily